MERERRNSFGDKLLLSWPVPLLIRGWVVGGAGGRVAQSSGQASACTQGMV